MTAHRHSQSRRRVLAVAGSLAATALAGCSGDDGGGNGNGNGDGNGNEDGDNGAENGDDGTEGEERTEGAEVVNVQATQFSPQIVEIEPGTTVRWEHRAATRTVTFYHEDNDRQHRVPEGVEPVDVDINPGDEFHEHTFEVPGVYDYFSRPNENNDQMIGSIIVSGNDDPDQPGLQEPGDEFEPFAANEVKSLNEQAREMLGM
jgi:plastocyanin